jgi:thiol-disulfide isomerase/thioredoxin
MFFNYCSAFFNKNLFFGNYLRSIVIFSMVLSLWGCEEFTDDLNPSGSDQRATVIEDVEGSEEGQILGDFTLKSTDGNTYSRDTLLAAGQPVVLYFTMWCPVCDGHMSHYINEIAPDFPNVHYVAVDFVSGNVDAAYYSQSDAGYLSETVLVDDGTLKTALQGSMGATIVVDVDGSILMNEDYKTGSRLRDLLSTL